MGGSGSHIRCSHSLAECCGPLKRASVLSLPSFHASSFRRSKSLMWYTFSKSPPSSTPCWVVLIDSSFLTGNSFRLRNLSRPASRTPTSSGLLGRFCHRAAEFARVTYPHLKPLFVIGDRNPPFHQIAHRSRPVERVLPLIQLRNHDFDQSVTKLHFLYTPATARNGSPIADHAWCHHA